MLTFADCEDVKLFVTQLTVNSPFGGALLVSISIEAEPGPSGLLATTTNLYFAPGSKPIDKSF